VGSRAALGAARAYPDRDEPDGDHDSDSDDNADADARRAMARR
jgi:hypothetical protein